jgi:hypothetical protein
MMHISGHGQSCSSQAAAKLKLQTQIPNTRGLKQSDSELSVGACFDELLRRVLLHETTL